MSKTSRHDHKVKKQREEALDAMTFLAAELLGCAHAGSSVVNGLTTTKIEASHAVIDG